MEPTETLTENTETLTETKPDLAEKELPPTTTTTNPVKTDKRKNPRTEAQIQALTKARDKANEIKRKKKEFNPPDPSEINQPIRNTHLDPLDSVVNYDPPAHSEINQPIRDEYSVPDLKQTITEILNERMVAEPKKKFRFENGYYVLRSRTPN